MFDERLKWKEHIKDVKGFKEAQSTKKLVSHFMGLGPENTLADPSNDSLFNPPILRRGLRNRLMCGPETTGCISPQRCKTGFFIICRTENLLCEASLAKLDEIRKLNNTKLEIRIVTMADYPITPYFMNSNKLDAYAIRPRNPQPLFVRTADNLTSGSARLDQEPAESVIGRKRPKRLTKTMEEKQKTRNSNNN
jgi:hypothetical protein